MPNQIHDRTNLGTINEVPLFQEVSETLRGHNLLRDISIVMYSKAELDFEYILYKTGPPIWHWSDYFGYHSRKKSWVAGVEAGGLISL